MQQFAASSGLGIQSWEWKVLASIILGIVIIIGIIWFSYYLSNKKQSMQEGFTTWQELAVRLNANRANLLDIDAAQKQELIVVRPDANQYIDSANILTPEIKDRIDNNFDIQFSQKLQDADIKELNNSLTDLKNKMSKLEKPPSKFMLKSLGGSAFDMLGNPNDFSLRIHPKESNCLGFSPVNMYTSNPDDKTYYSGLSLQCDAGGNDKLQRFKLTEIKNNNDYNKLVGDLRAVPNYYNLNNYPFMVAQPVMGNIRKDGMISECITFDNSGLSVEPCNGSESQRWHTYKVNI